jgi:hypothetical protein
VVLWVSLTVLTAVWVITLLAVAGLAWEIAAGTADAKAGAKGGGDVRHGERDQEEDGHGG